MTKNNCKMSIKTLQKSSKKVWWNLTETVLGNSCSKFWKSEPVCHNLLQLEPWVPEQTFLWPPDLLVTQFVCQLSPDRRRHSSHHPKGIKLFLGQESSFQQLVSLTKLVGKALTKGAEAHGPGEEAVPGRPGLPAKQYKEYQQESTRNSGVRIPGITGKDYKE